MKRNHLVICLIFHICLFIGNAAGQETKRVVEKPYVSEIEGIDDASAAIDVARDRLRKMVPNANKLYRVIRVEFIRGEWLCFFMPKETWSKDWIESGLPWIDYAIRVDPKTHATKVSE